MLQLHRSAGRAPSVSVISAIYARCDGLRPEIRVLDTRRPWLGGLQPVENPQRNEIPPPADRASVWGR